MSPDQQTICAVSTPAGIGGISVVRLSGDHAVQMIRHFCAFIPEIPESHRAYYGTFNNDQENVDEVVCTYFKKGRSFTGEDTVEISCHGNPRICQEILSLLVSRGARLADRGEFTYRAFMNGRIDLVQAESVLSLIESQSKISARQSLRQLQGSLSQDLEKIEDDLTWCLAHMEASIDFSTEGIEVVDLTDLQKRLQGILSGIQKLIKSYQAGRIIKDGYQLVLAGLPNVGKSSLLNLLIEEDKAIVTDVPGTTRDLVEAAFFIDGIKVQIVDTAGLRESQDQVERIGIERSHQAQSQADGVFFVFNSSQGLSDGEIRLLEQLSHKNPSATIFLVGNKSDKLASSKNQLIQQIASRISDLQVENLQGLLQVLKDRFVIVSALDKTCGELIKGLLKQQILTFEYEDQSLISQQRHYENLLVAAKCTESCLDLVAHAASPELTSLELKEALLKIQETLGKRFDDQIMDRVFKEFCIGK